MAATAPPHHTLDEFFDRIRSLGVVRPDEGRWIGGVAAGISRRWDIDPVLVRGGFVALSILGGIGVLGYGLAWLLLPQQDGRIHLQQAFRGDITAGFIGSVVLTLIAISGGRPGGWHSGVWIDWGFPVSLLITVGLIAGLWWMTRGSAGRRPTFSPTSPRPSYAGPVYGTPTAYGSTAPPAGPVGWTTPPAVPTPTRTARDLARERSAPSKPLARVTLGLALLAAAAILVVGNASDWSAPVGVVAAATGLAVIAGGVIVSGLRGRRAAGLVALGLILTIVTLASAGANHVGLRAGQNLAVVGSQEWRPTTADTAGSQFNLGVGEATLWLTNPAILTNATAVNPLRVSTRVGAGHLIVVLPSSVPARVKIQIGAGEVVDPDGRSTQVNGKRGTANQVQNLNTGPAGQPRLIVTIQQGVGQLEIKTATAAGLAPAAAATPTVAGPGRASAPASPAGKPTTAPTALTPTATN